MHVWSLHKRTGSAGRSHKMEGENTCKQWGGEEGWVQNVTGLKNIARSDKISGPLPRAAICCLGLSARKNNVPASFGIFLKTFSWFLKLQKLWFALLKPLAFAVLFSLVLWFLRRCVGGGGIAGGCEIWRWWCSAPRALFQTTGCEQGACTWQTSTITADPQGRQKQKGSHHLMSGIFCNSHVGQKGSFHLGLCSADILWLCHPGENGSPDV